MIKSSTLRLATIALTFWPASALAFCYQGSDINGALDYLVCLHNEQGRSINDLAETISSNANISNRNSDATDTKIENLENEIWRLQQEISALRNELQSLKP